MVGFSKSNTGAVVIGRPLQLINRSDFLVFVGFVRAILLSDINGAKQSPPGDQVSPDLLRGGSSCLYSGPPFVSRCLWLKSMKQNKLDMWCEALSSRSPGGARLPQGGFLQSVFRTPLCLTISLAQVNKIINSRHVLGLFLMLFRMVLTRNSEVHGNY